VSGGTVDIDINSPTLGAVATLDNVNYGAAGGTLAPGATFTDGEKITEAIVNGTNAPVTVSYTFSISANGCAGADIETVEVVVNPTPTMSVTDNNDAFCSGGLTDILLNSPTGGAVIELVNVDYASGNVVGSLSGGEAFTNGQRIRENLTNTTDAVQTVAYTFRADAAGCGPTADIVEVVTVYPAPSMGITNALPVLCEGTATDITLNTPTENGQIRVTAVDYGSGNLTGGGVTVGDTYPNGGTITEILANTTNTAQRASYTFEVLSTDGCGPVGGFTTNVDVNPSPIFTVTNNAADICSGSTVDIDLLSPTANATITLDNVDYGTAGGTLANGQTFTPGTMLNEVLTNATNAPATVTYTFSVSANGCNNPATQQAVVNVDPIPGLTVTNNIPVICDGGTVDIDINSPTLGAVATLDNVNYGAAGGTLAPGATFTDGEKITEAIVNGTNAPVTVSYTFSISANGCAGADIETVEVVVNPTPTMSVTDNNDAFCSGGLTDILLNSPTGGAVIELVSVDYASGNVVGSLSGGEAFTNGQRIRENLTNTTDAVQTVAYTFRADAAGCGPTADIVEVVTVYPAPSMGITNALPVLCEGTATDITLNTPTENGQIRVTAVDYGSGNLTGGGVTVGDTYPNGGTITEILANTTNTAQRASYTFEVLSTDGCGPVGGFTTNVDVNPSPIFTVTNNAADICSGSTVDIDLLSPTANATITLDNVDYGTAGGTLANGQTFTPGTMLNEVLTNATNAPATVTYTFSVSANGCNNPATQQAVVNVDPIPGLTVTNNIPVICDGGTVDIDINSPTLGAVATLDNVNYGAAGGTLAPGATFTDGEKITEAIVNGTNAPVTVSYTFSISANGCAGADIETVEVVVNPTPTMSVTDNNDAFCSGGLTDILLNSPTGGAVIELVNVDYASGNVVGSLSGGEAFTNGQRIRENLTNTTDAVQTVAYTFRADAAGCGPTADIVEVVTVYPAPSMGITNALPVLCEGTATDITLNTPTENGQIRVTAVDYGSGNLTGGGVTVGDTYPNGGTITEILANTTNTAQRASYTFEVLSTDGCGPVGGFTTNVDVNPSPIFTVTNNAADICSGSTVDIDLLSPTANATITLDNVDYGTAGGTLANGQTFTPGTMLNEVLTNATNAPATVTYTFSVSANGCNNPATQQAVVNVDPIPGLTVTNNIPVICSGGTVDIDINSPTLGAVATLDNVNYGAAGGTLAPGATFTDGEKITEAIVNGTNAPVTVSYTFSISANGCAGADIETVEVVVNPTPTMSVTDNNDAFCSGGLTDILLNSPTGGAVIELVNVDYASGNVVGSLSGGEAFTNGQRIRENLTNTTDAVQTVAYTFRADAAGCGPTADIVEVVTVYPAPSMGITNALPVLCEGTATDITLNTPTENGQIRVTAVDYGSGNLTGGGVTIGDTYPNGGTITEILANTTNTAQRASYTFEVLSTDGCGPVGGFTTNVDVNPSPIFTVTNNAADICSGSTVDIDLLSPTANATITLDNVDYGTAGGTLANGQTFTPGTMLNEVLTNATNAPATVTYTFSVSANGCNNPATQQAVVNVDPIPGLTVTNNIPVICDGGTVDIDINSPTLGAVATLDNVNYGAAGGTLAPGATFTDGEKITEAIVNGTNAPVTVSYTFSISANGCAGADIETVEVVVNPTPTMSVTDNNDAFCSGGLTDILLNSPTGGAVIELVNVDYASGNVVGSLSGGEAFTNGQRIRENLTNTTDAVQTVAYTFRADAAGCGPTADIVEVVTVYPAPSMGITNALPVLCEGTATDITLNTPTENGQIRVTAVDYGSGNLTGGGVTVGDTYPNGGTITEILANTTNTAQRASYTFEVLSTDGCGPVGGFTTNVDVNPSPIFTVTNNAADICSGSTVDIDLLSPTANATITLDNVDYGTAGGTLANGQTFTPGTMLNEVLTNATNAPATVTYTFSVSANGCNNPATQQAVVNVDPIPGLTVTNNIPVICDGGTVDIDINSPTLGAVATLDNVNYGAAGGTLAPGATFTDGEKITEAIVNGTNAPVTVSYTFSISANGCAGADIETVEVVVNPTPTMSVTDNNDAFCSGGLTDILLNSPTGGAVIELVSVDYASGNVVGSLSGGEAFTNGQRIRENLTNTTDAVQTVAYTFRADAAGCGPTADIVEVVTVYPAPSMGITNALPVLCEGTATDITLNTPTENGQIRVTAVDYGSGNLTGGGVTIGDTYPNGGTITEILANTTNTAQRASYTFEVLSTDGCGPVGGFTTNVDVNPSPIFTVTNNAADICSGSTVDIDLLSPTANATITLDNVDYGTAGGTLANGQTFTPGTMLNEVLTNATNAPATVTYTFSVSANGCNNPATQQAVVNVDPIPGLTVTNNIPVICSGGTVDIDINSPTLGAVATLDNVNYGAAGGTLAPGATFTDGEKITEAIVNGTNAPVTVSYTFSISANGCAGADIETVEVVVNPTPTMSVTDNNDAFCSGGLTDILLNSPTGGAVIELVNVDYASGNVVGSLSGGEAFTNGQRIRENLTNTTDAVQTVAYTFRADAAGCGPTADIVEVVTVYPAPSMGITNALPVLCEGTATDITLNTPTENGQIRVTAVDYGSGNLTGGGVTIGDTYPNGGTITEILANTTNTAQRASYTFEVLSTDGCGPVGGFTTNVDVNPSPIFTVTNNAADICSGSTVDIDLLSPTANATITLDNVDYGTAGGTLANGQTFTPGTMLNEVLTNATNAPATVTYTFSVSANGCNNPATQQAVVNVDPIPGLTVTNNIPVICSGGTVDIDINSPTLGAVATLDNVNYGAAGGTLAPGATFTDGEKITEAIVNGTNAPVTVSYTFSISANGCAGADIETVEVVVNPTPTMSVTDNNDAFCSGGLTDILLNSPTGGAVIELVNVDYASGNVVGSLSGGEAFTNGQRIRENLTNTTDAVQTVAYTFRADAAGCGPTADIVEVVTVYPAPSMGITNALPVLCEGTATDITLNTPTENGQIRVTAVDYGSGNLTGGGVTIGDTYPNGGTITEILANTTNTAQRASYTFEVLSTDGCGPVGGFTTNVDVNPSPIFTVTNNAADICSGSTVDIDLLSPTANATITLDNVDYGTAGGTLANGQTFTPGTMLNEVLTNATNAPATVTYTFSVSANGCNNPATQQAVVNVDPIPGLTVTNNIPVICSGGTVDIDINSPTLGAVATLDNVNYGAAGGTLAPGATFTDGEKITEAIVNGTNAPVTVSYTFSISANGCAGADIETVEVVVNPTPTMSVTDNNDAFCSGGLTDILLNSPTGGAVIELVNVDYASGNVVGSLSGGEAFTNGQRIRENLTNTTDAVQTVAYTFRADAAGCGPTADIVEVVTVYPAPSMGITNALPVLCEGTATDITLNTPTENGQIRVTAVDYGSGNLTGGGVTVGDTYPNGGTITEILANTTNTAQRASYTFEVLSTDGCGPVGGFTTNVDVNPSPIFTVTNNAADICSGSTVDIDLLSPTANATITLDNVDYGTAGGTLANGQTFTPGTMLNEVLTNATNAPATVTYTFSVSANGCNNPATQQAVVNVDPIPGLTVTNNIPVICDGGTVDIDINSPTLGAVATLDNVNYGAAGGTLAPGATFTDGEKITEAIVNGTNAPVTVSYTFSISANGCAGADIETVEVVVNPTPTMSVTDNNDAFCSGGLTDILLNSPTGGAVIELVNVDYASGNVVGSLSGGEAFTNGQRIRENLTNTTDAVQTVAYTFRADAAGCGPTADIVEVVTVYPAPSMGITNALPVLCEGTATDITLNTPTENGQIRVTAVDYGSGNLTGGGVTVGDTYPNGGTITEILANTTNTAQRASYTFEVLSTDGCGPVGGFTTNVDVNPSPIFTVTNNAADICSGSTVDIDLLSPTANATITLDNVDYGTAGGTLANGQTFTPGTMLNEVLTNATNAPATVTYTFSVSANGCNNPATQQAVVNVDPIPGLTVTNNIPVICSGGTVDIDINSPTLGAVATLDNVNYGAAGGTLAPGATFTDGEKITEAIVNGTNAPVTVSYTFSISANGCAGADIETVEVVVNPTPVMSATNNASIICDESLTDISLNTPTFNGLITVTSVDYAGGNVDGNLVGGEVYGNGGKIREFLENMTMSNQIVTYEFEVTANGCTGNTVTETVTVKAANTIFTGVDQEYCQFIDSVKIDDATFGGSVDNIFWTIESGGGSLVDPNVLNVRYLPSPADETGTVVLKLNGEDTNGVCANVEDEIEIIIHPLPTLQIFGLDDTYQVDDPDVVLAGVPPGGTFRGPGITDNIFRPLDAGIGFHDIWYTFTDANTCTDSISQSTEVLALPDLPIIPIPDQCDNFTSYQLQSDTIYQSVLYTVDWSGSGVSQQPDLTYVFDPSVGEGQYILKRTVENASSGSIVNEDIPVRVYASPVANYVELNNCFIDSIQFNDLSSIPNTIFNDNIDEWRWQFGDDSLSTEQNPKHKYQTFGQYSVVLEVTSTRGCRDIYSDIVELGGLPNIDFSVTNVALGDNTNFQDNSSFESLDISSDFDSLFWDYGDGTELSGSYSTTNNVTHVYASSATYDVQLIVLSNLGCIDSLTRRINIATTVVNYPYEQDFENPSTNGDWKIASYGNLIDLWELGNPTGSIISSAYSGSNAWMTDLDSPYPDNADVYVEGPVFNLSALSRPMMSVALHSNTQSGFDGAVLQYSINGGSSWSKLGNIDDMIGVEWYDARGLVGEPGTRGNGTNDGNQGWTGTYDNWKIARIPLDDLGGITAVQFRFAFGSDASNPSEITLDGFAFDDIWIGERSKNILLEHFTNLNSTTALASNSTFYNLNDNLPLDIVSLQYHISTPAPDVIYQDNPVPPDARGALYDLSQSPRSIMDGTVKYDYLPSAVNYQETINNALMDPGFNINIDTNKISGNIVAVNISLEALRDIPEKVVVHVVPIERVVAGFSTPSSRYVVKDMLPSTGGTVFTNGFGEGQVENINLEWDVNGIDLYDGYNLGLVVFVQKAEENNPDKEVYQSSYIQLPVMNQVPITSTNILPDANWHLYPNPANHYFLLEFEREIDRSFDIRIVDLRGVTIYERKYEKGLKQYKVDTEGLPEGVYHIIVRKDEQQAQIHKLIIVH
jgi:hypothetical protein